MSNLHTIQVTLHLKYSCSPKCFLKYTTLRHLYHTDPQHLSVQSFTKSISETMKPYMIQHYLISNKHSRRPHPLYIYVQLLLVTVNFALQSFNQSQFQTMNWFKETLIHYK